MVFVPADGELHGGAGGDAGVEGVGAAAIDAEAAVLTEVGAEGFAVGPDEGEAGAPLLGFVFAVLPEAGADGSGFGGDVALQLGVNIRGHLKDVAGVEFAAVFGVRGEDGLP